MAHIFINYRSIEQEFALKLARDLLQAGYPVWMDRLEGIIVPGDGVRRELEQGVNDAAAFLACLSGNYVESKWCRRELDRADGMGKPIIPVLIGSVPVSLWPIEVQDEHYADFRDWKDPAAYQAAFSSLLAGIEKQSGIKQEEPVVAPIPGPPDPRRDDPEDIAERGMEKVAELENTDGFAAIEAEELRKDMDLWMQMYQAAAQQNRTVLDEALRVKLQSQMDSYKAEWEKLNQRLQALIHEQRSYDQNNVHSQPAKEKEDPQKKSYNGKLLSLNYQDIEVRAVLQIIAGFTGLNVAVSDTVQGNLTLRLKDVPWDQALDMILRIKGLTQRRDGNVIYIAPVEEMAAREKLELEESLCNRELEPLCSELIQINYAKATALAALLQQAFLLSQRGSVTVDERTNTILVQDIPNKLSEIRNLVTRLDVPLK